MLRFETAGESHGQCLVAVLAGLPAGIPVSLEAVNRELWRRQQGYGRGERMRIEADEAEIVAGVRRSQTTGAPIAILIRNRDWENWRRALPVEERDFAPQDGRAVSRPRPGHADLAGAIKYGFHDVRNVLERASARETAARAAAGAVAKAFLAPFGIEVLSHVVAAGDVRLQRPVSWDEIVALSRKQDVLLGCVDAAVERRMRSVVDEALRTGDTVGGVFEVVAHNVPPGLGSHTAWDARLDGKLAQALMSIQAVKGVEIGRAIEASARPGSQVQDPIRYDSSGRRFVRDSNWAGGLEGGVTNGEDVVARGYLKPISTLRRPLMSVDLETRQPAEAAYERSDVCVLPAAGVVGEAMAALIMADAMREKFGGDSLAEARRNFDGYMKQVRGF